MKTNKIICGCLLALLLFASCENDIEFKGEISDPMLVMNGFIQADSIIRLRLTESRFFLNTDNSQFPLVKDAVVKLYVNGGEKETLLFNDSWYEDYGGYYPNPNSGYYTSVYRPKEGDNIKVAASNPKFKEVSSTVSIPHAIPVVSVDTSAYKLIEIVETTDKSYYTPQMEWVSKLDTVSYYAYDKFAMKVNIDDRKDEKNFYRIGLSVRYYYENGEIIEQPVHFMNTPDFDKHQSDTTNRLLFTTSDPVFNKNSSLEDEFLGSSEISPYLDFPDVLFDGKKYGLNLSAKIFRYSRRRTNGWIYVTHIIKRELLVNLHSISKDYYYYIRSYAAHENNEESIFMEPVQIHSNIKGGIGILGASSTFTYTFTLPQE